MRSLQTVVLAGALAAQLVGIPHILEAQKKSATARPADNPRPAKLVTIRVVGSEKIPEADIIAYTGLQIGNVVGPQQFREAADRLGTCGAFDEVQYKYEPADSGYSLTFTVAESPQLIPVTFDNYVWFTDAELTENIRKTIPLFRGFVPSTGEMLQQVTDALQEILSAQSVKGTVRFEQEGGEDSPQLESSPSHGTFTIDGVDIRVREVNFPGASDADLPDLQNLAQLIRETAYHKAAVRSMAEASVGPLFAKRGFLKARIGEITTKLLNADPGAPEVRIEIPVEPGTQYSLATISWSGIKALPIEELQQVVTAKSGAPANAAQLQSDMDSVKAAYGRKGYLRVEMESHPSFNETERTLEYDVKVREGDIYRFKSIDLDGLDAATTAKLREEWKLREGEPFDSGYEREYLKAIRPMLAPNISISADKDIDDEAKTVEVSVHFITHTNKVVREKDKN